MVTPLSESAVGFAIWLELLVYLACASFFGFNIDIVGACHRSGNLITCNACISTCEKAGEWRAALGLLGEILQHMQVGKGRKCGEIGKIHPGHQFFNPTSGQNRLVFCVVNLHLSL